MKINDKIIPLLKKMWECEKQTDAGRLNLRGILIMALLLLIAALYSSLSICLASAVETVSMVFLKTNSKLPQLLLIDFNQLFIVIGVIFVLCLIFVYISDGKTNKKNKNKENSF